MPISFRCVCEKTLKVADKLAGKSVTCPACGTVIAVPDLAIPDDPGFEVVEETSPPHRLARAKPVSRRVGEEDPQPIADERYQDDDPPKRKKRNRSRSSDEDGRWGARDKIYDNDDYSKPIHQRWTNPGVWGGVVAMVGAVLWFVMGLILLDRIYFYPPILFICGALAFLRGMGLLGHSGD